MVYFYCAVLSEREEGKYLRPVNFVSGLQDIPRNLRDVDEVNNVLIKIIYQNLEEEMDKEFGKNRPKGKYRGSIIAIFPLTLSTGSEKRYIMPSQMPDSWWED